MTDQTPAFRLETLGAPSRTERVRSAVFALVFAPIALLALGFSATALFNESIYGMPLASAEGVVGMLIGGILLCLIALNCEESAAGMYVTAGWAAVVAVLQYTGNVPFGSRLPAYSTDTMYSLGWAGYPIAVALIALGAAVACTLTRRRVSGHFARVLADPDEDMDPDGRSTGLLVGRHEEPDSSHSHVTGAVASVLACAGAAIAIIDVAPTHSRLVALEGLVGLGGRVAPYPFALLAGLILGVVALGSTYSVLGTQVAAWGVLIIPFYLVIPLWTSLTGHVCSPDATWETALGLSSPIITSLGLALFALTSAVHWTRRGISTKANAYQTGLLVEDDGLSESTPARTGAGSPEVGTEGLTGA